MAASFMLVPFVAALGYKNSCHREERSDLQLTFDIRHSIFDIQKELQ